MDKMTKKQLLELIGKKMTKKDLLKVLNVMKGGADTETIDYTDFLNKKLNLFFNRKIMLNDTARDAAHDAARDDYIEALAYKLSDLTKKIILPGEKSCVKYIKPKDTIKTDDIIITEIEMKAIPIESIHGDSRIAYPLEEREDMLINANRFIPIFNRFLNGMRIPSVLNPTNSIDFYSCIKEIMRLYDSMAKKINEGIDAGYLTGEKLELLTKEEGGKRKSKVKISNR